MTEQNFKGCGRLIAFGAVLLAGCTPAQDGRTRGLRVIGEDSARGVVCYAHDGKYGISCVKVKP